MMRSMYSAVSALRVHQTRMDVIGNNIANVNTPGYKASRVVFAEAFSQTLAGAGPSSDNSRGGTNPQQVGLGTNLAAITTYHTQGATQRTDNQTDIMIEGGGYFVLSPNNEGEERYFSRAGNFIVDEKGYMVAPNGYKLLDETFKPVQIDRSKTKEAKATESVILRGNIGFNEKIDPETKIAYSSTVDVYDTIGNTHTLKFDIGKRYTTQPGANPAFSYRMVSIKDPNDNGKEENSSNRIGTLVPPAGSANVPPDATSWNEMYRSFNPDGTINSEADPIFMQFDANGKFVKMVTGIGIDANGDVDPTVNGGGVPFNPVTGIANYTGSTLDANWIYTVKAKGTNPIEINLHPSGDKNKWVFNNLTHFKMGTDIKNTAEGRSAGMIKKFTISSNGEVKGAYTNGENEVLARIGLANFDNPSGLLKEGGNLFSATSNSGTPNYGRPSAGSFGSLTPGAYEMSNVDLSAEFTDMITTQRGFQANSRVVTTSDEILQELVNLKR